MSMLLELDPETEARLNAQAQRRGIAPEQYAGEFLRQNLPRSASQPGLLARLDLLGLRAELTKGAEKLPVLPPEATERASFYEDRW